MTTTAASARPHGGFAHESTVNETFEWYTPPEIFTALDIEFDLDPCSPGAGKSFVPAKRHYTIEDDGLTSPWFGTVWVNSPYGPETKKWVEKLVHHGDGIGLFFSRTDNKWFQQYVSQADAVCFVSSRVKFFRGGMVERPGSPGAGSMLIAYGDRAAEAVVNSGLGECFAPIRRPAA